MRSLLKSFMAMLERTRTERQTTDRGVVSHLVRSHRRVDLHAMLISVGLNVSNTNPPAYYPMQTFIMCGTVIATAPCHRGENDALLVQLRGSKEMLIHPPALVIPGCPASVCGDAAAASNPRWLKLRRFERAVAASAAEVAELPPTPGRPCACCC